MCYTIPIPHRLHLGRNLYYIYVASSKYNANIGKIRHWIPLVEGFRTGNCKPYPCRWFNAYFQTLPRQQSSSQNLFFTDSDNFVSQISYDRPCIRTLSWAAARMREKHISHVGLRIIFGLAEPTQRHFEAISNTFQFVIWGVLQQLSCCKRPRGMIQLIRFS